jgi:hypothetical protein
MYSVHDRRATGLINRALVAGAEGNRPRVDRLLSTACALVGQPKVASLHQAIGQPIIVRSHSN